MARTLLNRTRHAARTVHVEDQMTILHESTPSEAPEREALSTREVHAAQGVRVLVVDDNADAADLLGEALSGVGYDVRVAYEGRSALALASSFQPHVALLDIGLPGMSGFELAVRLRKIDGLDDLRCIAITGYGHADDRRRSAESGFQAHILKPIDFPGLEKELQRLWR